MTKALGDKRVIVKSDSHLVEGHFGKGEGGSAAVGHKSISWVVAMRRGQIQRGHREENKRGTTDNGIKADQARAREEVQRQAREQIIGDASEQGEESVVGAWGSMRP